MVNRILEEGGERPRGAAGDGPLGARRPARLAARRSAGSSSTPSVVGQTFWEGSLAQPRRGRAPDLARRSTRSQEKDLVVPTAGSRLAGEREYAFKHVLIRDVAYSTLPKAVAGAQARRGRRLHRRARGRPLRGRRRDGRRALRPRRRPGRRRRTSSPSELERDRRQGARRRSRRPATPPAALYSNQEALGHYETALVARRAARRRTPARGSPRSSATSRCGSAASTARSSSGRSASSTTAARRTSPGSATCTARSAPALWHKGDREGSIEHYQRGIDLLKDGPPCLELVRLYEEAASLYMHTGDNMLAIYASEKALRLAERLGEAAAASRAHGIFGRVFGRIGDSERARENLERSVELARESDPAEAVRALLTLGYHLEVSEADYEGAARRLRRGAGARASETGDLPSQVELHAALAQLAVYRGDWEAVERETDGSQTLAEREGLTGKLCFPYVMRGAARAGARRDFDAAEESLRRAAELGRAGRAAPRSRSRRSTALGGGASRARRLRRRRQPRWRGRSTSASAPASSPSRSRRPRPGRSTLALAGRADAAREAAEEAARPRRAAPLPGRQGGEPRGAGASAADPDEAAARCSPQARDAWLELGRPLDAARSDYLRGRLLLRSDGDGAREALDGRGRRRRHLRRRAPRRPRPRTRNRLTRPSFALRSAAGLVLAEEALEQALVALLVVEDRDHHVLGDRVDPVGLLDDPAVVLDRARLGLDHALDHVDDVDLVARAAAGMTARR